MAYYGKASERVIAWIKEDENRLKDFNRCYGPMGVGCLTVQQYLNTFAHRPGVIHDLVRHLRELETERLIYDMTKYD